MSEHKRELPGGGTVEMNVVTDDELVENMVVSSVEIAIRAIRNVENGELTDLEQ